MSASGKHTIYTIGHSTHCPDEFIAMPTSRGLEEKSESKSPVPHRQANPGAVQAGAFIGAADEGKIYELAGDEAYTLTELAAETSKQTGKDIPYNNLTEADYAAALSGAGLPEWLAEAIAGWDTGASKGDLFDDSKILSGILGRPSTPLSEVVKRVLA